MLMLIEKYVCGKNSLYDFIKFLSDEYYVDVIDGKVELLPFNNMQLPDIMNDGNFRV